MDKVFSSSLLWKRCSQEYGSPGDILFSTVAGAPPHVHSPQKLDCFSEHGKSLKPVKPLPISLSNSLIDPNIDLPAISVREVDAVLSSLNSSVSSTVAPDEVACKTLGCETKSCDHNFIPKCSEAVDICSVSSPIPFEDTYIDNENIFVNTKEGNFIKKSESNCPVANSHDALNRRAFSLNMDKVAEKGSHSDCDSRASSCLLDHTSGSGNRSSKQFCHSDEDRSPHDYTANNNFAIKSVINNGSMQERVQIFTLHSLDSLRILSKSCGMKMKNITCSNTVKDECASLNSVVSAKQNLDGEKVGSISRIKEVPLPKPRDRSPFVSLDLATEPENKSYKHSNETVKCREANLFVRMANQAQFFPSRSVGSLVQSITVAQPVQSSPNTTISCSLSELVTNGTPKSDQTPRLVHVQPSSGDDRFKYACPHPRCGRRYQAELALLRHLHKYHCEPIELPHRRRPPPNRRLHRRPASEERSRVANGAETTVVDGTMRMLHSSISVEETISGTGKIALLPNRDSRTSSHPPNSLHVTAATTAPTSVIVMSANSSDSAPQSSPAPHMSAAVLNRAHSLSAASDQIPALTVTGAPGLRRCIVLPHNGLKDSSLPAVRPALVRSTSISHNFPQLFNVTDSSSPAASSDVAAHLSRTSSFRVPRLRSVSGSVSSPVEDLNPHDVFGNDRTSSRSWHSSELRSLVNGTSGTTTQHVWPLSVDATVRTCNRSDDSSGGGCGCLVTESESVTTAPTPVDATCPSCGFDLDESDANRREWMSGIRALTYSKTDSITCPMDGCAHVCSGRADLSAHLTANHFPEVQNQLVRLIFACPLKDCQTVCPDEVSFQAHFNRHLFGYLPGDLSGLFSSGLTTSTSSTTPTATTPTEAASDIPDNDASVSRIESTASTPTPLPTYPPAQQQLSNREDVYMGLANPNSDSMLLGSTAAAVTETNSTAETDASKNADPMVYAIRMTTGSTEPRALSDPSILVLHPHRQSAHSPTALYMTTADEDSPGAVHDSAEIRDSYPIDPELIESPCEENPINRKACSASLDANRCPTSITFDGGHVDLTDHRNLLSALDLIPDDILMELLKEDRPGIWGETSAAAVGPSNFTTYSAPHEWDSPNWAVVSEDDPEVSGTPGDGNSHSMNLSSSEVALVPPVNSRSLDEFALDVAAASTEDSLTPSSTNWVPSPVVHETWSLAVANERPYPASELDSESPWACHHHHSPCSAFDCPSLVLSDLTAALILPEVERRLRAKHESSQHGRTNNTAPTAVSPLPAAVVVSSETVEARTRADSVSMIAAESGCDERHTRPSLGSGKRRRNASESSPTAHNPCDQCISTAQPQPSTKSGKHGCVTSEVDQVSAGLETGRVQVAKENKRTHGSMTHTSNGFTNPPTSGTVSTSPRPVTQSSASPPTLASQWIGRATSYQRLYPTMTTTGTASIDDDSVFVYPASTTTTTTQSRGGQRELIDLVALHASPKHFGAQPKRRRRKLAKVYTMSSDLIPVVPNTKSSLQRRHSLVYCNLVPSANLPR